MHRYSGNHLPSAVWRRWPALGEPELQPLVTSLVRKEVLSIQADPRSPERGQYSFLQDLLKRVAYETLAKTERKLRHLAAAEYLAQAFGAGEQEIVEVIAAHYLDAYRAAPDADDAPEIKARAGELLVRAGERAASLAANDEAQHCFERAADLADEPLAEAALRERAGGTAYDAGRVEEAQRHYERARELYEQEGQTHPAARVSARLGEAEWRSGSLEKALDQMERAFAVLSDDEPDEDFATLAAELGRLHFFKGEGDVAMEHIDTAVEVAESLWLPEVLSQALNTQGLLASLIGRSELALALMKHALELALDNGLSRAALRAYNNVGDQLERRDRYEEAIELARQGIELSRKDGRRVEGWYLLGELGVCLTRTGRWDEALEASSETPESAYSEFGLIVAWTPIEIAAARGDVAEARRLLSLLAPFEASADLQDRWGYAVLKAVVLRAEGEFEAALASAEDALEALALQGFFSGADSKLAMAEALESALALGRLEKADELLAQIDAIPLGKRPPLMRGQAARFRARVGAARGAEDVEQGFKTAAAIFREHSLVFDLAVAELEHGEWLVREGRSEEAEPLLAEARDILIASGRSPGWSA